ncbi:hypothetical protein F4819DRAFT_367293 [Hypoxylon fuscum]|nr:hypothetical protein F4819DRAFT_367293 [Hypoxylon fuscum]
MAILHRNGDGTAISFLYEQAFEAFSPGLGTFWTPMLFFLLPLLLHCILHLVGKGSPSTTILFSNILFAIELIIRPRCPAVCTAAPCGRPIGNMWLWDGIRSVPPPRIVQIPVVSTSMAWVLSEGDKRDSKGNMPEREVFTLTHTPSRGPRQKPLCSGASVSD